MLTDGRTDERTDDGHKVITIAHPVHSSGELKLSQWTVKCRSRSNIDDCIQEVMLRCIQVPHLTDVAPKVRETNLNRKT